MLQHLLHTRAFPGHRTSADWIISLTAINAPLNGSLSAYALGLEETSAPNVVWLSPGRLLGCLVHVLAFLDCKPFGFDLGMDHWQLSWRGGAEEGRAGQTWSESVKTLWQATKTLLVSIFIRSAVVESEDNAAFDSSLHSAVSANATLAVAHDCTYYLSLVGTGADANMLPLRPATSVDWGAWVLWLRTLLQWVFRRTLLSFIAWLTLRRRYQHLSASLAGAESSALQHLLGASDGLCSVFSQSHPQLGIKGEPGRVLSMPPDASGMSRGVWYVQVHGQDHMGIVPFPVSAEHQRCTFAALFQRLRSLPMSRASSSNTLQAGTSHNLHAGSPCRLRRPGRGAWDKWDECDEWNQAWPLSGPLPTPSMGSCAVCPTRSAQRCLGSYCRSCSSTNSIPTPGTSCASCSSNNINSAPSGEPTSDGASDAETEPSAR
jgi:hypothetical protein